MKVYLKVAIVLALGLLIGSFPGGALAQEEEVTEYSWGTVSSVSPGQIVVTEYDYASDEEVDVTYSVAPDVELKNVDSIENIAVGTSVDIDYVIKDEKRVAKTIAVEEPSYEEYEPSQIYEEEPELSPQELEY